MEHCKPIAFIRGVVPHPYRFRPRISHAIMMIAHAMSVHEVFAHDRGGVLIVDTLPELPREVMPIKVMYELNEELGKMKAQAEIFKEKRNDHWRQRRNQRKPW